MKDVVVGHMGKGAAMAALLLAAGSMPGSCAPGSIEESLEPRASNPRSTKPVSGAKRLAFLRFVANEGCEKNSIETRVSRRKAARKEALEKLRTAGLVPKLTRKAARELVFKSTKGEKRNGPRWMRRAKNAPPTEGNE